MREPDRRRPIAHKSVELPIWQEVLVLVEIAYLQISPIYWGFGVPPGDGSAVVVLPGFLGTDRYLDQLRAWLERIGYRPFVSRIELNAACPNLLIRERVTDAIHCAWRETGKKVHLVGHSLGGMLARSAAAQMPDLIESVITLGSPLHGVAVHPSVLRAVETVRRQILVRHGHGVLPQCYTGACTCDFLESLMVPFPKGIRHTAIYTKSDGIVDPRVCLTGDPQVDCEVTASHLGLVFSPLAYEIVAKKLAGR